MPLRCMAGNTQHARYKSYHHIDNDVCEGICMDTENAALRHAHIDFRLSISGLDLMPAVLTSVETNVTCRQGAL